MPTTGLLKSYHLVLVRRRDHSLRYSGDMGFDIPPQRLEEDIWEPRDLDRFQAEVLKPLNEYNSLAAELGEKASMLEEFARRLSGASFRGLSDMDLAEHARAFDHALAGGPLSVTIKAFISGLSLTESPVQISDRFIFRWPTENDFVQELFLDHYGGFAFPLPHVYFSAVGEFKVEAISAGVAQKSFMQTLQALSLFRVGSVTAPRYNLESKHPNVPRSTISSGETGFGGFAYALSNDDAGALQLFLRDIVPLLPDPFSTERDTTSNEIAYSRYKDDLQGGNSDRVITSAITALEALFLNNEGELTHRLAQRTSAFLRILGTDADAQETYRNVSKGYKIRSKFIHGGSLKTKDRPQADALMSVLLEYARKCVLAFYQLSKAKDEILAELDHAMIAPSSILTWTTL